MSESSSKRNLIIGGAVAGGVALVGALAYRSYAAEKAQKAEKKKAKAIAKPVAQSSPAPTPVEEASPPAAAAPAATATATATAAALSPGELSKDDLVDMFKDIVAGMDSLIFQLARKERELRSQETDKERVLAALSQAYQEKMQEIQCRAFEKFNTTEEIAERAVMKYQEDPAFKQVRARMDLINNALMGGVPPPDPNELARMPDWLTVDKVIEIFTAMMTTMTQSMVDTVDECSAKHSGPPPHEEVNASYMEKIAQVKDTILSKYNLEEKMLDVAMLKYANDPTLANVMIELQSQQEQTFKELRAKVWG